MADHDTHDHTGVPGVATGSVASDSIWDAAGDLAQGTGANTAAKLSAGSTGQVLTSAGAAAANTWKYPPGYELDYVAFTSPVTLSATSEATATTIVTGSAVAYDGSTVVEIEFYTPYFDSSAGAEIMTVVLYDGAGSIGKLCVMLTLTAVIQAGGTYKRRLTPSAATHTYSIRGYVNTGSVPVGAGAGGSTNYMPGFIRITRV